MKQIKFYFYMRFRAKVWWVLIVQVLTPALSALKNFRSYIKYLQCLKIYVRASDKPWEGWNNTWNPFLECLQTFTVDCQLWYWVQPAFNSSSFFSETLIRANQCLHMVVYYWLVCSDTMLQHLIQRSPRFLLKRLKSPRIIT